MKGRLLAALLVLSAPAWGDDWTCPAGLRCGGFFDLNGRGDPAAAGGGMGVFIEPRPWSSLKVGPRGFANEEFPDLYGGLELAGEWSVPARVSPFAGLGGFLGWGYADQPAEHDGRDDDGDGLIDEAGETRSPSRDAALVSVHPVLGLHVWVTKRLRLSVSGQYEVTSAGRRRDFWFYNLGVGFVLEE